MWKCAFLFLSSFAFADLRTVAEKTDWKTTGRYEEIHSLCQDFQRLYPREIRCEKFGKTVEGRDLLAVIVSQNRAFKPEVSHRKKKPILFFQGGIHSGEIDGKDAGFLLIREVLEKKKDVLQKVTLVFVPIFNIDGHERFGKYNRPNQVGPEEMGWRTTSQNLNVNRDYAKAETPEMRAMLRYLVRWDPTVYVDLHVTDGAQFQHSIAVMVNPSLGGNPVLDSVGKKLSDKIQTYLKKAGRQPLDFYPSFNKEDDPSSGISLGIASPRFSQSYWGTHQRFGILVETHSWKDYKTRVFSTKDTLSTLIELAVKDGKEWLRAQERAVEEAKKIGGKKYVLEWDTTKTSKTIEFEGYRYEISDSKVSGQKRIQYFPNEKEIWKIPFFYELEPKVEITAPTVGYVAHVGEAAWIQEKLETHGIIFQIIKKKLRHKVKVFRATDFEFGKKAYEGRQTLSLTEKSGRWQEEEREIPAGSLFIPIRQPNSFLVLYLFEPLSRDSFLSWGFFNAHFEQKEYMEAYVTEEVAREMLKDEKISREFEEKLKEKAFAQSPEMRLEFFYRQHPSWDERFALYPVFQVDREIEPNYLK